MISSTLDLSSDFLNGFGLYSLFYLILSKFNYNFFEWIKDFDEFSSKVTATVVLLFLVLFTVQYYTDFGVTAQEIDGSFIVKKNNGIPWMSYWLQALLFSSGLLLWIRYLRQSQLPRALMGILFLSSTEKYLRNNLTLGRDYLPSSWTLSFPDYLYKSMWNLFFFLIVSIAVFFLFKTLKKRTV